MSPAFRPGTSLSGIACCCGRAPCWCWRPAHAHAQGPDGQSHGTEDRWRVQRVPWTEPRALHFVAAETLRCSSGSRPRAGRRAFGGDLNRRLQQPLERRGTAAPVIPCGPRRAPRCRRRADVAPPRSLATEHVVADCRGCPPRRFSNRYRAADVVYCSRSPPGRVRSRSPENRRGWWRRPRACAPQRPAGCQAWHRRPPRVLQ